MDRPKAEVEAELGIRVTAGAAAEVGVEVRLEEQAGVGR